jgi:DNA-binding winged helix-turn-helix (wHTH) protein/TolB-like protein
VTIVDLAHTPDFRLGDVWVRPARRQIVQDGGKTEVLQPRVMQVLLVLARAEGAVVTRDELTEACWQGVVVGEDAINRVIGNLRRRAESLGESSFRIETVAKVGYRLDCPAPPTPSASQAEPPLGEAVEPSSQQATPVQPRRHTYGLRRPTVVALAALISLMGVGIWLWKVGIHWPGAAGEGPNVAIAPFEVIGGGAAARETAKVVADDALSELGANALHTVAATGVFPAPRSVQLVLNGEVQLTSTNARIVVHLFDPKAQAILWSGEVAGDRTNLGVLQQQASHKAADMLTCGLDAFAPEAHLDAQARVLWLGTCDTWRQRGTLGQARDAMRVLMQRNPKFSGAYAKYALATARMGPYGPPWDTRAVQDEARTVALRGLQLNPDEADAYVALSLTEPTTHWFAREQWLLKGLAHQPNSGDLTSYQASLLSMVGRTREMLALARRAVDLDPFSPVKTVSLANGLYFAGKTSEAIKVEDHARLTWPQSPDVLDFGFERALRSGDAPTVARLLSSPQTRPVDMLDAEALLWPKIMAERRGSSEMRAALGEQIVDLVERGRFNDFWGVLALRMLNEDDAAYALMLKLSEEGHDLVSPQDAATMLFQPEMSNLRTQPRFMKLAANLGLTAYWLRSGKWPDFCSDPGLSYSCPLQARAADRAEGRR